MFLHVRSVEIGGRMAVAEGMGVAKLLYIIVVEDDAETEKETAFRYTRSVLQSTLQLMGCKARHAFKVAAFLINFFSHLRRTFIFSIFSPNLTNLQNYISLIVHMLTCMA